MTVDARFFSSCRRSVERLPPLTVEVLAPGINRHRPVGRAIRRLSHREHREIGVESVCQLYSRFSSDLPRAATINWNDNHIVHLFSRHSQLVRSKRANLSSFVQLLSFGDGGNPPT